MTLVAALLVVATLSLVAILVADAAGDWRKFASEQAPTRESALRASD
jgi:hypothetical protein